MLVRLSGSGRARIAVAADRRALLVGDGDVWYRPQRPEPWDRRHLQIDLRPWGGEVLPAVSQREATRVVDVYVTRGASAGSVAEIERAVRVWRGEEVWRTDAFRFDVLRDDESSRLLGALMVLGVMEGRPRLVDTGIVALAQHRELMRAVAWAVNACEFEAE